MARKQVVQVQCSRCDREETLEATDGVDSTSPPVLEAKFLIPGAQVINVRWDDLCGPCIKTVRNHLEAIGKKVEGVSPDRKEAVAKKKEGGPTAPSPLPVTQPQLGAASASRPRSP